MKQNRDQGIGLNGGSVKNRLVTVFITGALCAYVIRPRVSYNQNDETISRNSLRYLSKANLPIAVN